MLGFRTGLTRVTTVSFRTCNITGMFPHTTSTHVVVVFRRFSGDPSVHRRAERAPRRRALFHRRGGGVDTRFRDRRRRRAMTTVPSTVCDETYCTAVLSYGEAHTDVGRGTRQTLLGARASHFAALGNRRLHGRGRMTRQRTGAAAAACRRPANGRWPPVPAPGDPSRCVFCSRWRGPF